MGFESSAFNLLAAPAGTPESVVSKLNAALNDAFKSKELRERFTEMGLAAGGGTPKETAEFVERETAKWRKVIQDAKLAIE